MQQIICLLSLRRSLKISRPTGYQLIQPRCFIWILAVDCRLDDYTCRSQCQWNVFINIIESFFYIQLQNLPKSSKVVRAWVSSTLSTGETDFREWETSLYLKVSDNKNLGESSAWREYVKMSVFNFLNLQMPFPVIWTPKLSNFSPTIVRYRAAFRKKWTKFLE